jgi:beta-1,4-mannosyl-glycoprotein beta-1,4-N-acetylglucosaminyltransferase
MIYDCFTFFNELELLELRLNELAGVVDKFVVVEATRTFSNQPKPLYFQENRERFAAFADKIIHVVVNDSPDTSDAWEVQRMQRNCIGRGLTQCRPDDWIMVSDLDEIPRATAVEQARLTLPFKTDPVSNAVHSALNSTLVKSIFHRKGFRQRLRRNHPYVLRFEQGHYCYYLNCRSSTVSYGTRMMYYRDFSCAEEMRYTGYKIIKDGGWHFSWMGGVERMEKKIAACSHREHDQPQFNNPQNLARAINDGSPLFNEKRQHAFVPLDETFPRYLFENPEKFSQWLKPVSG